MTKDKKCMFCDKKLKRAIPQSKTPYQPYGGGEVNFIFAYGSTKFDNCMGTTYFKAVICDECAEFYVDKMEEVHWNPEDVNIEVEFDE